MLIVPSRCRFKLLLLTNSIDRLPLKGLSKFLVYLLDEGTLIEQK